MVRQFPPSFRYDPEPLEHLLSLLSHDTEAAQRLERGHEPRLAGSGYNIAPDAEEMGCNISDLVKFAVARPAA